MTMDKFESTLKSNAYYGRPWEDLTKVDIEEFIELKDIYQIGKGLNTRVFKIKDRPWVLKEGRWDLDFNFLENLNIKLPAQITEDFLKQFDFYFLPNKPEIKRQYELYLKFINYFGYFDIDRSYHHPNLDGIIDGQKEIRRNLIETKPLIEKKYSLKLNLIIDEILKSELSYHNFLPNEYLLYGKSFTDKNKGNDTYFIFQEYIKGQLLHDHKSFKDEKINLAYSILLAYLVLLISAKENYIPDLRPRNVASKINDWFLKTDNVMLTENGLKFIDTRWMWGLDDNLVKRGVLIPEMTLESTKLFIKSALDLYAS